MRRANNKIIKSLLFFLIFSAVFVNFSPIYSESENSNALEIFLDRLAKISEFERVIAGGLLQTYIVDDVNKIDELKLAIDDLLSEGQKDELASYGYTVDDVRNELDGLKLWSKSDRQNLVDYIIAGDTSGLSALIKKYGTVSIGIGNGSNDDKDEPKVEVNFDDISNHWAKDNILFMADKGIVKGKGENKFSPEDNITRAEFAALIVRTLGIENNNYKISFKDIENDKWYYEPIAIAYNNDIVSGKSENTFDPNGKITRQEMAIMTVNALKLKNLEPAMSNLMMENELNVFNDRTQISSWAKPYCAKIVKSGLIKGKKFDTFAPKDNATRAEAATILLRLYELLNK